MTRLALVQQRAGADREANVADATALADLMFLLDSLAKPTLARVNGAAFGGAVGLDSYLQINPEALQALYRPVNESPWAALIFLSFSAAIGL